MAQFACALIFTLNLIIAWRLFHVEFTTHMGSNEGMFMAISRILSVQGFHFDWFPYWFNGIPFENTYSPLLQIIDALLASAMNWSAARAFHFTLASFYAIGPVLLFLFAWRISGQLRPSFLAAILYSLFSPSTIFPAVRADIGGWTHARRLQTLVTYGEGAHNIAIALLPLALLLVWLAVKRKQLRWDIAAGGVIGAMVLMNAFAAVDLALAIACLAAFYGGWRRIGVIGALAYLWISPFLTPTLIQTIRANSANAGFHMTAPAAAAGVLIVAGVCAFWWIFRLRSPFDGFVLSLAWIFTIIPAAKHLAGIELFPQAERYHLEMELAVCLASMFALRGLLRQPLALGILIGLLLPQYFAYRHFARGLIEAQDVTQTIEYRTAKWIAANLPGKRVLVSGDVGFWFNLFADNPRLGGGHDPFSPNWNQEVATYAIYSGALDVPSTIVWLKAFGAQAITVPGPGSAEVYHPFRNPKKFEGVLPVLERDGDNAIYAIPQRSGSGAHVIPESAVVRHVPINGLDVSELNAFVASLEDPTLPLATFDWSNRTQARIAAPVQPGQAIALQMTYDRGWAATANGRTVSITRDGIGLMTLHPACQGPCEIVLKFEGGLERQLCRLASWLVMAGVFLFAIVTLWTSSNTSAAGTRNASGKAGGTASNSPAEPA